MAIFFELGIFLLAFVFAWWQFRDLRRERERRESRQRALRDALPPEDKSP